MLHLTDLEEIVFDPRSIDVMNAVPDNIEWINVFSTCVHWSAEYE